MTIRAGINYQIALIDATANMQEILTNQQATDSEAGSIAATLLDEEYRLSTIVLEEDAAEIEALSEQGTKSGWSDEDTEAYNAANQLYQNDTITAQTGQSNASNAVQRSQTQVGQDGTNTSNIISLAGTLASIGNFMSSLLSQPYTA